MSERQTAALRNLAFVGQSAAGKTALAEALVRVATGRSAVSTEASSDLEPEERELGRSLFPRIHRFDAEGVHVNLIDTPGTPDLIGPSLACLAAVETVVAVVHAHNGVEPVTQQLMEIARSRRQPRVIVINGIDRPHLDLKGLLADIRSRFGPECLPINLPAEWGRRVEDCLLNSSGGSDLGPVGEAHRRVLDQIIELDDALMENYLAGREPDYAALHSVFERALDEAHVVPICFTSASKGVGIHELLSVIVRHFPSPAEGNPRPFVTEQDGREVPFPYVNDPAKPLLAHVFRVTTDPVVGKVALFRVHQGTAHAHRDVFIGHSKRGVKIAHLLSVNGRVLKDVGSIVAGDLGAVPKIEELAIGDVLHDDHALDSVHLTPPPYPLAERSLVIVAKGRHDDQKLTRLLHRFAEEDPTLRLQPEANGHGHVVQALGEFTLKVILERIRQLGVVVEKPPEARSA